MEFTTNFIINFVIYCFVTLAVIVGVLQMLKIQGKDAGVCFLIGIFVWIVSVFFSLFIKDPIFSTSKAPIIATVTFGAISYTLFLGPCIFNFAKTIPSKIGKIITYIKQQKKPKQDINKLKIFDL